MKKLILVLMVGLMSTGMFANNNSLLKNSITPVEKSESDKEEVTIKAQPVVVTFTIYCADGSVWYGVCGGCSIGDIIDIAEAVCD